MKIWSVIFYAAPTSMLMIEGMANLAISGRRGAEPRGLDDIVFFALLYIKRFPNYLMFSGNLADT